MIAKASTRVAGGSFGRLAAYVTNQKRIGDLRDWRRTADYILDRKGGGSRVEAIRVTNCANQEPGLALAEIAATQACNTSSKTDKTYHLIVSFPPGEKPTADQLRDIEDTLCAAIGLADHQRISAVHNDRDHFHFHVAINKVHPVTLRNVTPIRDHFRLQAACVELEIKHGLTQEPHTVDFAQSRERKARGRAADFEARHGGQAHSNVMYIPAAPECPRNRSFLVRQLPAFLRGNSPPDFPPDHLEVTFSARAGADLLTPLGRRQMGL